MADDDLECWTSTFLCAVSFSGRRPLHNVATNKHIRIVLVYDAVSARDAALARCVHHAICAASTLFSIWGLAVGQARGGFALGRCCGWKPAARHGTALSSILKLLLVLTLLVMSVQFLLLMLRAAHERPDNV